MNTNGYYCLLSFTTQSISYIHRRLLAKVPIGNDFDIGPTKKLSWSSVRVTLVMSIHTNISTFTPSKSLIIWGWILPAMRLLYVICILSAWMLQSRGRCTSKEPSGCRTYPVTPSGRIPRVKLYLSNISYAVGTVDELAVGGAAIGGSTTVIDAKDLAKAVDGEATMVAIKRIDTRRWR